MLWTSFLVDEIIFYFLSKRGWINLREAHYNRGQKQFSGQDRTGDQELVKLSSWNSQESVV